MAKKRKRAGRRKRVRARLPLGRLFKRLKNRVQLEQPDIGRLRDYFAYFGDLEPGSTGDETADADEFVDAVRKVQGLAKRAAPHLKVDGIAGPTTLRHLERLPRCGEVGGVRAEAKGPLREAQRRGGSWGVKPVLYYLRDTVPGYTKKAFSEQVRRAADEVQRVCGLKLEQVPSEARANMILRVFRIDGPGRTLGVHDIVPTDNFTGTIRGELDSREPWNDDLIYRVVLHECHWHGIGYFHWTGQARSIGEPFLWNYTGYTQSDEITLQKKYGPPEHAPDDPAGTPRKATLMVDGTKIEFGHCSLVVH